MPRMQRDPDRAVTFRSTAPVPTAIERFGWIPAGGVVGGCPPVRVVEEAVNIDLGISDTRDLVDHLSACPRCFSAWRRARAARRGKILQFSPTDS